MILFKKSGQLRQHIDKARETGRVIGFVPTMGALHQGHLSLLEASQSENGLTVTSIFVNPAQFNDPGDFAKYPITLEKDIELLISSGTDILFIPSVEEIYPLGIEMAKKYPLGDLDQILEGKYRPGHFQGVSMVMHRLLDIIAPNNLYMGQKDFQQCLVIKNLLNLLHSTTRLHTFPTLREKDGLAMSSRNLRLNPGERKKAVAIFEVLQYLKKNIARGSTQDLINNAAVTLQENGFKIDYVEIAHTETLSPVSFWDGSQKLVALVAASLNEVRLIDNVLLNE